MMDYAIERDGGRIVLLLENGDRITLVVSVGSVKSQGRNDDGSPRYNVQWAGNLFVDEAEPNKVKA
jgi:hypothetical protein